MLGFPALFDPRDLVISSAPWIRSEGFTNDVGDPGLPGEGFACNESEYLRIMKRCSIDAC
jgi:hypothetical protein